MLIRLNPEFFCGEEAALTRIKILEERLRVSSDGTMKVTEYGEWIREAGVAVPTRQTLHRDIERYTAWCDDIEYGDGRKILKINPHASRDALRYFLGEPWVDSPMKPKLSSSVCRCFLLSIALKREIEFPYGALPKEGAPPTYKIHRGVPLRTIPGSDSGYMAIWQRDGRVFIINLARVQGRVSLTGSDIRNYSPPIMTGQALLEVRTEDGQATERYLKQFEGGIRKGNDLLLPVPKVMGLMMSDILESWWRRTSTLHRQADRTFEVSGKKTVISLRQEDNPS